MPSQPNSISQGWRPTNVTIFQTVRILHLHLCPKPAVSLSLGLSLFLSSLSLSFFLSSILLPSPCLSGIFFIDSMLLFPVTFNKQMFNETNADPFICILNKQQIFGTYVKR